MTVMNRAWIWSIVLAFALVGCSSTTATKTGSKVDDSVITTKVKSKLAAEKIGTLTKVHVDTVDRTVHLTGTVTTPDLRDRAGEVAARVDGVRQVVNDIQVAAAPR